jgi:hypothetical protein
VLTAATRLRLLQLEARLQGLQQKLDGFRQSIILKQSERQQLEQRINLLERWGWE